MKRAVATALLALLLAGGCGGGGTRGPVAERQGGGPGAALPSSTASAQPSTEAGGSAGAPAKGEGPSRQTSGTSGSDAFAEEGPGDRNTLPLAVTINRRCADRGDTMESEAVTVAGAQIAFAAAYAGDNSLIPDMLYVAKESNVTGRHTWRWVIRPQVPDGDAVLSVVVAKGNKGATYKIPFRISGSC